MRKLVSILLVATIGLHVSAQHLRGPVETSPLARQLLTNDTPVQWWQVLGISTTNNNNNFSANQFVVSGTNVSIKSGASLTNLIASGSLTNDALTSQRVVVSGANKELESSSVTTTELNRLSGVTSSVQQQIDDHSVLLDEKVNAANNGTDFLSLVTTRKNLGIVDINTDSGISGGPEFAWTNSIPAYVGQIGVARNSAVAAIYIATGTSKGNWNGSIILNGSLQAGTDYWDSNAAPSTIALKVIGNGNTNLISDTGPAQGSEQTVVVMQKDPRQAVYINFSAPSAVSMPARTVTMSNPVDFQIGLSGILYGTNTLGGLPMRNDALLTLNQGTDLLYTTTENKGIYGTRSFYEYDNTNGVHHFPVDRADNGIMGTPGHQVMLSLDSKNKTITSTNASINFTGPTANIGPSGVIQVAGANEVYIGTGAGTVNSGKLAAAQFNVSTTAGTLNAPTFLNRVGSKNNFINWDVSGNTQIGRYVDGTGATDIDIYINNDHTYGYLRQSWAVGTNITPLATLDVRGSLLHQVKLIDKTSNYTVKPDESGAYFTNDGAAGNPVTNTLPAAVKGLGPYTFSLVEGSVMTIKANGAEVIQAPDGTTTSTTGGLTANVVGTSITVYCGKTGHWQASASNKSWTRY